MWANEAEQALYAARQLLQRVCGRQSACNDHQRTLNKLRRRVQPQWPLPRRRAVPPPPQALKGGKQNNSGGWGDPNRLADTQAECMPDVESSSLHSLEEVTSGQPAPAPPEWQRALASQMGRLQYHYFNWRQDTWSDLQLFMVLNSLVFLVGAWVEGAIIRNWDDSVPPPPEGAGPLVAAWNSLYKVLAVVLGQDLPGDYAGWPSQLFAIFTAIFGLASFALVLALIEQVVLEVLERNVKRGSMCYESGHTVVLAWCESSRDIAQLTRILTQLCAANRTTGGGVVVVLTQQRGKLEMEQLFREVVPEEHRFNTRFVFRQGSPLDPAALRLVAAVYAQRVLVCGDYSRPARDADAQVLRACVLLDELIQQEVPTGGPVVVAQIKTEDAMPLVRYSCSQRVIPVPTNRVNARRYVRLLHNPIATVFSRNLVDFYSPAHAVVDTCPEAEGLTFAELHSRFPDALVVGVYNQFTGYCQLNPPPDRRVQPGDDMVVLRSSRVGMRTYRALPEALPVDPGAAWDPHRYVLRSLDEQPAGTDAHCACLALSARASGAALATPCLPDSVHRQSAYVSVAVPASAALSRDRGASEPFQGSSQGLYVLPMQYSNMLLSADELLICGWMGQTFMWELMAELDHSDQGLPTGSRVTLFNEHQWMGEHLEERCRRFGIRRLDVRHVCGDPRSGSDMQRLVDISKFKAAIVVCDSLWAEGGQDGGPDPDHGLHLLSQAEMLSLDSAMLMVQLNIRLLLEEAGHPNINIICEKLTYVGVTRFEDDTRLPLGIAVNSASYAAKVLTHVAVDPRFLKAYMQLGVESDLVVQDASSFAAEGEALCFLQLQARAASVRQVLLGFYRIPATPSQPLEVVVNPQGLEERSRVRIWNNGDFRCKLVTLAVMKRAATAAAARWHGRSAAESSCTAAAASGEETD